MREGSAVSTNLRLMSGGSSGNCFDLDKESEALPSLILKLQDIINQAHQLTVFKENLCESQNDKLNPF